MMRTATARLSTLLALGLLVACGGPNGVDPRGPVTATITPEGGTIVVTTDAGARLTLGFPAGTVREPLQLTVTPRPPEAGVAARFELAPAGLVFDEAVTVNLELPARAGGSDPVGLYLGSGSERVHLPTQVQQGALTTDLRFFDVPVSGAAVSPAGALRPQAPGADELGAIAASCSERIASAQGSLDALLASNAFEHALRLILNTATMAALCGDFDEADAWLERTEPIACARYDDLALIARTFAADDYDTFTELVQPVVNWAAQLRTMAAACPEQPVVTEVVGEKYTQFLTFYGSRLAGLTFTADHARILDEARKVWTLRGQASLLGLPAAETMLETVVLFPMMDLLRARSFEACRDQADHYPLSMLLAGGFLNRRVPIGTVEGLGGARAPERLAAFDDAAIRRDLQYCASSLDLEVWADPEVPTQVVEQNRHLGGGSGPGQAVRRAAARAPVEGSLVLRGAVEPFRCGEGRTIETQALAVRFEGQEIERTAAFQAPIELDLAALVAGAGRAPTGLNDTTLTVVREAKACGGTYGGATTELFTVDLEVDPAPALASASADRARLDADVPALVTFTLPYEEAGDNLATLAYTYRLGDTTGQATVDLAVSDSAAGFDAAAGDGTYQTNLTIFCSEAGQNPVRFTFRLEDDFAQRSEERSVDLTVDYAACDQAAAAGPLGVALSPTP